MHSQTTHELHTTGVRLFVFDDCFFSFFFPLKPYDSTFEMLNGRDVVATVIAQSSMCVSVTLGEQV